MASASVFSRLLSFGLEVLIIISVLLNTGDAGSVCERAGLCVRIEWPGRMWKQEDGYPSEIHQVKCNHLVIARKPKQMFMLLSQ